MSNLKELKNLINSGREVYTIDEIKNLYESVNTNGEVIVAQQSDISHIYYRNNAARNITICKELLPYEKKLCEIKSHKYYPVDLCNLIFYDEYINRYAQGIIIPRINKFVMIDNFNLIRINETSSFYTTTIDENNKMCEKLTDRMGNIYELANYGNDFSFNIMTKFSLNSLSSNYCGFVISYKGNPVYANICEPPYIIFDKETFLRYCENFTIQERGRNYLNYVDKNQFDDNFMVGNCYTKKL